MKGKSSRSYYNEKLASQEVFIVKSSDI